MGMLQDSGVGGGDLSLGRGVGGGGEHSLQQSYSVQVVSSKEKVEIRVKGEVCHSNSIQYTYLVVWNLWSKAANLMPVLRGEAAGGFVMHFS